MSAKSRLSLPFLAVFTLIVFLAFWLRIYDLNTLPPGLHYDESRNWVRAWRLAEGEGLSGVYDDIPEPFDPAVRSVLMRGAGNSVFVARLVTVFVNILAVAATIGAARALYRRHAGREIIALIAGLTLAVIPASVIMGRTILRTNWIPLMSMLALMMLAWAWHTQRWRYYVLLGVFTALTLMFYLVGLVFPVALALTMGTYWLIARHTWPGIPRLLSSGLAAGITLIPWLYFYFTVPEWLEYRTDATKYDETLRDLPLFFSHMGQALSMIFLPFENYPQEGFHWAARYNTFETPYLNPLLLILLLAGLWYTVRHWYQTGVLAPLIILLVFFIPGASSDEPLITSRRFLPWRYWSVRGQAG